MLVRCCLIAIAVMCALMKMTTHLSPLAVNGDADEPAVVSGVSAARVCVLVCASGFLCVKKPSNPQGVSS